MAAAEMGALRHEGGDSYMRYRRSAAKKKTACDFEVMAAAKEVGTMRQGGGESDQASNSTEKASGMQHEAGMSQLTDAQLGHSGHLGR